MEMAKASILLLLYTCIASPLIEPCKQASFHLPLLIVSVEIFFSSQHESSFIEQGCLHNTEVMNLSRLSPLLSVIRLATLFLCFTLPEMLFLPH